MANQALRVMRCGAKVTKAAVTVVGVGAIGAVGTVIAAGQVPVCDCSALRYVHRIARKLTPHHVAGQTRSEIARAGCFEHGSYRHPDQ